MISSVTKSNYDKQTMDVRFNNDGDDVQTNMNLISLCPKRYSPLLSSLSVWLSEEDTKQRSVF